MTRRVILITGSGSGIGAATARRLAAPGVAIMLHARQNLEGCTRVAAELRERGAESAVLTGDLGDTGVAAQLVARTVEQFGGLDVLVANAGFPNGQLIGQLDRGGLERSLDVILGGFFELASSALPHLQQATDARVIAISSLVAHIFRPDYPLHPASAAAKAGLEAMVRSLAVQLGPMAITCNCVAPGLTSKDHDRTQAHVGKAARAILRQVPLGRKGTPEEIAATVAFLASRDAAYITGQVIHVNGGIL